MRNGPLTGLARPEAVGRVLTKGSIRWRVLGFSSRPLDFPAGMAAWDDLTGDAGRPAPYVVVRRLDGGAPVTRPTGSVTALRIAALTPRRGSRWELEPERAGTG